MVELITCSFLTIEELDEFQWGLGI